jgi:transcriptional regulator with XRE-family HTH domain
VDTFTIMTPKDINHYMICNQLNSKQLANRLGISESYMSMLRQGRRRPSPDLAQKIENVTGIPFKKLLLKKGRTA